MDIQYLFDGKEPSKEYIKEIAHIKRLLEYSSMVAGFKEGFFQDMEGTLQKAGLEISSPKDMEYILDDNKAQEYLQLPEDEKPLAIRRYKSFIKEKLSFRQQMQRNICQPQERNFQLWRNRQVNRCWGELGTRNASIIHTPLIFELSKGCSVGCPFCGVAAEKLQRVAKYAETKELWQGILKYCRELLGEGAASTGTIYYASEPLDNPDYQQFSDDFFSILGKVPQITTAVATRNIERTRGLLKHLESQDKHVHRFSILSKEILEEVFANFSPEELIYVELLPQFPEAPSCQFARTGRAREYDHPEKVSTNENTGTISCVSGFIVNMAEKSLRLVTPCLSSEAEPTGERIICKEFFTDLEDFKARLVAMIKKYMTRELDNNRQLKLRDSLNYNLIPGGIEYYHTAEIKFSLKDGEGEQGGIHQRVFQQLRAGTKTGYDIISDLMDEGYGSANIIRCLNEYYQTGLLLEPYEIGV